MKDPTEPAPLDHDPERRKVLSWLAKVPALLIEPRVVVAAAGTAVVTRDEAHFGSQSERY